MKRFQEITRKVVSIKTFTKRYSYVDDEHSNVLQAVSKLSRDQLLGEVNLQSALEASVIILSKSFLYRF